MNQRGGGIFLHDLEGDEFHRLVEAIAAGGLQLGLAELIDDVGLGFAEAVAAGLAAFEVVVSKELDVRPPGLAVEMSCEWCGLPRGNAESKRKDSCGAQGFSLHSEVSSYFWSAKHTSTVEKRQVGMRRRRRRSPEMARFTFVLVCWRTVNSAKSLCLKPYTAGLSEVVHKSPDCWSVCQ